MVRGIGVWKAVLVSRRIALFASPTDAASVVRAEVMVQFDQTDAGDIILDRQVVKIIVVRAIARPGVIIRFDLVVILGKRQAKGIEMAARRGGRDRSTCLRNYIVRKRAMSHLFRSIIGIRHAHEWREWVINDERLYRQCRVLGC